MISYTGIIENIAEEIKPLLSKGKVATYIPALSRIDPEKFGMAVATVRGELYTTGDAGENFSIQSISKVFTLAMVMDRMGDALWDRVGREASGNPFNSLVQLEYENGKPRNPFINAGALVVTDCVIFENRDPLIALVDFVRKCSGNQAIDYDREVAGSEKETGHRNAALANFLKSYGNLFNEVDRVLDLYFHQCALSMNCMDLARAFLFLAHGGTDPVSGSVICGPRQAKRINALMQTCGLYDEGGEFAYRVGLPGKSGVGGGIVAVMPGELAVAVWSPGLNSAGNSLAGMKALELFTTYTARSIF
ncbi:glutaminase [Lentimicrobium sp.]|uniref:glutaminase n=1 Tax=Lentimicrobium sp. TaxID=2034841 RepID=UPI002D1FB8C9|nr:glutaminase [Lentimicrobium sp.]